MKDFLVPGIIAVSIGLFALFIFGFQRHINPRPPGVSYAIGLEKDLDLIRVLAYQFPDSLLKTDGPMMPADQATPSTGSGDSKQAASDTPASTPKNVVTQTAASNTGITQKLSKMVAYKSVAYGPRIIAMNMNPKLMIWILTFSLMVAVSFALGAGFIGQIANLSKTFEITTTQWTVSIIFSILLFLTLCCANMQGNSARTFLSPLNIVRDLKAVFDRDVFCWWIYPGEGIAFLAGSIAFLGILVLHAVISNKGSSPAANQQASVSDRLTKAIFQELKAHLDLYLGGFSVLVVFSILTISFLNQTLIGHFVNIEELHIIKSEFIYAYGFVFSSLLALIYIPTNQRLRSAAEPGSFDEASKEKNTIFNNYTSLLSILAPLLSSGFSELIKDLS